MVRVSCARSPHRAFDAGDERQSARPGIRRQRQATPSHLELSCRTPEAAGGPRGTVASSSARHGRLRRNAVSPHGVRLSGAPGAPLRIGCSSANSYGTVLLPYPRSLTQGAPPSSGTKGAGCPAGARDLGMRTSGAAVRALIRLIPPGLRTDGETHGGTQSVAAIADLWLHKTNQRASAGAQGAAVQGRRA